MTKIEAKEKMKYAMAYLERKVIEVVRTEAAIQALEKLFEGEPFDPVSDNIVIAMKMQLGEANKDVRKCKVDMFSIIDQIDVHYVEEVKA